MTEPKKLSVIIAIDTLNHLGMNLYGSLPPVLSELVANAYDARARRVDIRFDEYLRAQKSFGGTQSILAKLDAVEPSE